MFPVIFLLWVIFNARLTTEIILTGLVISAAMFWVARKYLGYAPDTGKKFVRFFLWGLRYVAVLIWETVKSNLYVSKTVYSRNISIQPRIVFFKTNLKSVVARVVLANSITLTPGTLTVVLNDGLFCVHCLDSSFAEGIDKSIFAKQLVKIDKR